MKTERKLNPAQKKAGEEMKLLFSKLSGMKKVPLPLRVVRLPLGLGVEVGYCILPGRKVAMGFVKGSRILPVAVAEKNEIRPLPRLKNLVRKVQIVTLNPDGRGGALAQIPDSFGNFLPLGKAKKEGKRWGLEGIRLPLPKSVLTSLSFPALLSTLFMGEYLPALLCGFPLICPEESVPYHFLTQLPRSAISSMENERKVCRTFGLRTCGFEEAVWVAIDYLEPSLVFSDVEMKDTEDEKQMAPISFSIQNGSWNFSSSFPELGTPLSEFEAAVNLCRFTSSLLSFPVGYYRFLDVMQEALKNPFAFSDFKNAGDLMRYASQKAREISASSLEPEGEWNFRKAFFSVGDSFNLPLPVKYSVALPSHPGRAVLRITMGGPHLIPAFLASHPLGKRYLLFLYSLSVARALCCTIFAVNRSIKKLDLFIESDYHGSPDHGAQSFVFLAKGSFEREDFLNGGKEKDAQDFFRAHFVGETVKSPYFTPLGADRLIEPTWYWFLKEYDPSFELSMNNYLYPESSWGEIPKKFAPALGTYFIADLSIEREKVMEKAYGAFESLVGLAEDGKIEKERAVEKIHAICDLVPDPELKLAANAAESIVKEGKTLSGFNFELEKDLRDTQIEAEKLFINKSTALNAVRLLEERVKRAEEGFDISPLAPSRYFGTYGERIIYNKFLSSGGEYTVLLPNSLFSAHVALEEMIAKLNGVGALEQANWQVLHAPATPLAHLNQYKELSRLKDWEAARAAARNMLEVSVENKHIAMAYRNLGYCFWMEEDLPLASACYQLACALDASEHSIRTERWILEKVARSSHILLPDSQELLPFLKEHSIPIYPDLPGLKVAKSAAQALVDLGFFIPAGSVLQALSTLPGSELLKPITLSLFT
ncbi:MAG: hypothetical protein IIY58_02570 [Aeriscardovia sp.]|nr:hypothetical protein [Aeriscardovia sp.]